MSVDLSTKYLGLKLKNPLVIAACPLTEQLDTLRGWRRPARRRPCSPRCSRSRSSTTRSEMTRVHEFGTESFAESLTYFPEAGRLPRRARKATWSYIAQGQEGGDDSRSSPASTAPARAAGSATPKMMQDAGADALELNIYFVAADLEMTGREVESRVPGPGRGGEAVGVDPAGGEGRAVLQRHGQHGPAAGRGGRRRPGAVQPLPPAGHRPGDAGDHAASWS